MCSGRIATAPRKQFAVHYCYKNDEIEIEKYYTFLPFFFFSCPGLCQGLSSGAFIRSVPIKKLCEEKKKSSFHSQGF